MDESIKNKFNINQTVFALHPSGIPMLPVTKGKIAYSGLIDILEHIHFIKCNVLRIHGIRGNSTLLNSLTYDLEVLSSIDGTFSVDDIIHNISENRIGGTEEDAVERIGVYFLDTVERLKTEYKKRKEEQQRAHPVSGAPSTPISAPEGRVVSDV